MATRKNFKKTGRKRIKPKGGAKKRKTVRGGMFKFLPSGSAQVHPFKPIDGEHNWFSTLNHLENQLNTDALAKNEKYQKYINEFKNNSLFREYIFTYIHALGKSEFKTKLDFIKLHELITDEEFYDQKTKYDNAHP